MAIQHSTQNLSSATQLDGALAAIERQADDMRHMLNARIMADVDDMELYRRIATARAAMSNAAALLHTSDLVTSGYVRAGGSN